MRKVTQTTTQAFNSGEAAVSGNTRSTGDALILHGHTIAWRADDGIYITNCGYFTNVTKERLNGITGVSIYQKDGEWFLNGKSWDGKLIKIN